MLWEYGNGDYQTQYILIGDFQQPVVDNPDLPQLIGNCEILLDNIPTALDAFDGVIEGVANTVFPITDPTITEILWTYTDSNGNSISQTQEVTIENDEDPTPTVENLSSLENNCLVELSIPTAMDACGNLINGVTDNYTITDIGVTEVIWTYMDVYGNFSQQTQTVTITAELPEVNQANELLQVLTIGGSIQ